MPKSSIPPDAGLLSVAYRFLLLFSLRCLLARGSGHVKKRFKPDASGRFDRGPSGVLSVSLFLFWREEKLMLRSFLCVTVLMEG